MKKQKAYKSSYTVRYALEASKMRDYDSMDVLIHDLDMTLVLNTYLEDLPDADS